MCNRGGRYEVWNIQAGGLKRGRKKITKLPLRKPQTLAGKVALSKAEIPVNLSYACRGFAALTADKQLSVPYKRGTKANSGD